MHPVKREAAADGAAALELAIRLVGAQWVLADAIGVTSSAISVWRKRKFVPLDAALRISAVIADPRVSFIALRPDLRDTWALLLQQLRNEQQAEAVTA